MGIQYFLGFISFDLYLAIFDDDDDDDDCDKPSIDIQFKEDKEENKAEWWGGGGGIVSRKKIKTNSHSTSTESMSSMCHFSFWSHSIANIYAFVFRVGVIRTKFARTIKHTEFMLGIHNRKANLQFFLFIHFENGVSSHKIAENEIYVCKIKN